MEKEDAKKHMKYDLDYIGTQELFDDCLKAVGSSRSGDSMENCYLPDFNESILEEAERLNVLLPLIKWQVDNNKLTEFMSDELYLYYEDLLKGRLDGVIDEEEASLVIGVLTECYIKAFGKDTLDEEDQ